MEIKNIELIKKIINNISIPAEIGLNEDDSYEPYALTELEEEIYDLTSNVATFKHGVTKGVIITDSNVVIKFPFTGMFYIYEDEESEEECTSFTYFDGANDSVDDWEYDNYDYDYCVNELYKYNKIVGDGFGEFIAEIQEIKNDCGNTFYLQEKIITKRDYDDNNKSIHSENSKQIYESLDNSIKHIVDSNWMQDVIEYYGERKAVAFFNYIHDNYFDEDLHYGNLGYRMNGAPVLFDIAGFRS